MLDMRLSDGEGNVSFCIAPDQTPWFTVVRATGGRVHHADAMPVTVGRGASVEDQFNLKAHVVPEAVANIVWKTADGRPVSATELSILQSVENGPGSHTWGTGRDVTGVGGEIRLAGLISGVPLTITTESQEVSLEGPTMDVTLKEGENAIEVTLRSTHHPSPYEQFVQDLAVLKDVRWKKADPIQKDVTWYGLDKGLAMADADRLEIKRFTEMLGETDIVVSGIAFDIDKVWVGTNKGLFCWDRKEMFWTRFAVAQTLADAPIEDVSLTQDGLLAVVVKPLPDQPARTFLYDVKKAAWQEKK